MNGSIRLNLTHDEICAVNNALRREIEIQQRLRSDKGLVGVDEYVRHLESALGNVTRGWEKAFGPLAEKVARP